ncbi:MAG: FG-GAP-like repeat-containing protein, partial [Armatimonadota bacterium]
SKNKQFQLGELQVLASNDGFETDTRTLVDLNDDEMHGNWGAPGHAPHRYAFEGINESAKDLRFICTPRPDTAMYIAELQVWGTGEGLAAEATQQGEALNPFTCLHTADIDGDGFEETVAGSEAGLVYCLDSDGELMWKFDTQNTVNAVSTVDFNGDGTRTVVAGGISGRLFALDTDGTEKWVFQMPHYKSVGHINTVFAADLTGEGNEIAVAGGDNWRYYAVDASGEEIWHYESVHGSTAGAAADLDGDGKDAVIAGTEYYWWHCVNPDGSRKWGMRTAGGPGANDVTTGDLDGDGTLEVLFGGADTLVQAVSTDGDHLWTFSTGDEVQTVICQDINGDGKDEILAASVSFNVYCLDGEGKLLWRKDLGRPVNDITVFESETGWNVVAACDDGSAYLLDGTTGDIGGVFETGGSVTDVEAAVYNGDIQIIAASRDGHIYGLGQP